MTTLKNTELAHAILEQVFAYRQLHDTSPSALCTGFGDLAPEETQQHVAKIENMLINQSPITMVLPAYPGKSPNRNKTLSKRPDLAERYSLDRLNQLCEAISALSPFGVQVLLCSDGYVFSDLVRIPDRDVALYTSDIRSHYAKHYPQHFDFYDIKDAYPQIKCLDSAREELMIQYGESLITLSEKARTDPHTQAMYRGITKFMYEDFQGLSEFAGQSNTQIQQTAKRVALRVIQRSNAWSCLLEEKYPDALRLSIHPQLRVSHKIGIRLCDSQDNWRTPWHSVAIKEKGKVYLETRSQIDENRYRLIFTQGTPCHYLKNPSYQQDSLLTERPAMGAN